MSKSIPVQRINSNKSNSIVITPSIGKGAVTADSRSEQRGTSFVRCDQELGRVATHTRNVYRDKTPEPIINTIYERAPTPEPDVIEKIYITREPQQIYETVYQRPKTPPPLIIEKHYVESAPEEIRTCKVVEIDHTPRAPEQLEIKYETVRVNADFDYNNFFEFKQSTSSSSSGSASYHASSSRSHQYQNQAASSSSYNGFQRTVDLYSNGYRF